MPYFNQVENPKRQDVLQVKLTPKGLILVTQQYDAFLYQSSKETPLILQALEVYASTGSGYILQVIPDEKQKNGFRIGTDSKKSLQPWFFNSVTRVYSGESETIENPFLQGIETSPNPLIPDPVLPIDLPMGEVSLAQNSRKVTK